MPDAGRVIAGSARGLRLEAAPAGTRPLADRVKEALFASLESAGALSDGFLDLFAGTGAAGIEALSRGAKRATFVEQNARACAVIESNLRRAALTGGTVVRSDVMRFMSAGNRASADGFAGCLVDPPYDTPLLTPTLEVLGEPDHHWLADGAVVVAKHFWRDAAAERVGNLALERQRRFGETTLSFYRQTGKATVGSRRQPGAERFARSSGRTSVGRESAERRQPAGKARSSSQASEEEMPTAEESGEQS